MTVHVKNAFLFNFAVSRSEGGYKRLQAYAQWFNERGGASFIIHPLCEPLQRQFPHNRFFVVSRSNFRRLLNDWSYLEPICSAVGPLELYYAYGIPLYQRVAAVNWSHVNNILTLGWQGVPLETFQRLKLYCLKGRMRRGFALADIISAESRSSVELMSAAGFPTACVSVNGSDDELAALRAPPCEHTDNVATVVGTYSYKGLDESLRVFRSLQKDNAGLKLLIVGNPRHIPRKLHRDPDVVVTGLLERPAVIEQLRRSRYFITTTLAENSYNCAAEGIFLARESYISPIGPHRELLAGEKFAQLTLAGATRPLLHVKRADLTGVNLRNWDNVIRGMITQAHEVSWRASEPEYAAATLTRQVAD